VIRILFFALLLAAGAGSRSFAQTNPAAPPVSSEPEVTTATYGAWTLHCVRQQQHVCEVEQSVVPDGQQRPIAQIAVDRQPGKDEFRVTAVLPTDITFEVSPRVTAQDKDPGVELAWRRCVPGGCIADADLKEETLRAWHSVESDTGRLYFTNAAGRKVAIEFSFRGFGQAMDAFNRERS